MELFEACAKYIAFLRTLYLLHQNSHWLSNGKTFYADHLMFERLYKSAAENADLAAEKFIGLCGSDKLKFENQPLLIQECFSKYVSENCSWEALVGCGISAEQDFLKFSEDLYKQLKADDAMTLGLDDMIMSIASDRETALYLLKQTNKETGVKMSKIHQVARKFQIKLAQSAPDLSSEQIKAKLEVAKLEQAGAKVISDLIDTLGMKGVQPNDIQFTELKFVEATPGKSAVSWRMSVSPSAAQAFNEAVARNKQAHPAFSVANYVGQLLVRYMPGVALLPAQPITVG